MYILTITEVRIDTETSNEIKKPTCVVCGSDDQNEMQKVRESSIPIFLKYDKELGNQSLGDATTTHIHRSCQRSVGNALGKRKGSLSPGPSEKITRSKRLSLDWNGIRYALFLLREYLRCRPLTS